MEQSIVSKDLSLEESRHKCMDTPSINAFKSRLVYIRDNRMGYFVDYSPLSPRPYWLDDLPVRLRKVKSRDGHETVKPETETRRL